MDVNLINPFISAITGILPQLGFKNIKRKSLALSKSKIKLDGIVLNLGIVGDKTGNVIYNISEDTGKIIASTMMGADIKILDDLAKSAISEMSNMLTANSTINLSNSGINVDISVPTMLYGNDIDIEMSKANTIFISFDVDGMNFDTYISID